ncbi:MAG: hypothetical protein AMJ81_03660 [Phycisphaerae bacterium SM23_33]|nr:MAG: hypothetical protein AMJ81_03660 [Phycisphaerae bacterium SM23_33]
MSESFAKPLCLLVVVIAGCTQALPAQQDPYENYVSTSADFKSVKQDKDWCLRAWPSWTYMPWTYQWTIGYDDAAGRFCLEHGYNGAFLDWGRTQVGGVDKLAWINQHKLRFYVDHTAAKRYLHLFGGQWNQQAKDRVHGTGVRTPPVNAQMAATLKDYIRKHVSNVKSSPYRAAYALDDEISWGHFVHPCMWQVTDDPQAYPKWLAEIYGSENAPRPAGWISYEAVWPKLKTWSVKTFDASRLMDQWTFNDACWTNFLGELVEYANSIDPDTPCGFVGGQSPNAFGGYDYARLMRKVQFIESYNIGGSQAVIRSFNPHNALPTVTTHFHKNARDTVWQVWYYLAHGNRGFIGWVQAWFDGKTPKPWHAQVAPHYRQANETIGPLMSGAEWIHDGVAILYDHPSIQLSWILDAEAHGKTWINRNDDHRLGSAHLVRHAWENMLRDEGIQYDFISYVDLIQKGIPAEYKVLVLPGCLCLSDAEARRIRQFCSGGGTVIADYLPGLWDQHGKGRQDGGVLDDMFGAKHDPDMQAQDVFGTRLWCETDQDANFGYKAYDELLTKRMDCIKDASGFNKAVRKMGVGQVKPYGRGTAVLMNLSPQWYNAYRAAGVKHAAAREVFMRHVKKAGPKPWVWIEAADKEQVHGHEITYWSKDGRTIVFVCFNPEVTGSMLGGGNAAGLKSAEVPIALRFARRVRDARDERQGKGLGDGDRFKFQWKMNEAVVLSFAGPPPR